MPKHILLFLLTLINFRTSLIKNLLDCGHKVTALAPKEKNNDQDTIQKLKLWELYLKVIFYHELV